MDEQKGAHEKAGSYDYSTPIDFRPNRIDDRLNLLNEKLGENSERLARLEALMQKFAEDVTDIKTSINKLSDRVDNIGRKKL